MRLLFLLALLPLTVSGQKWPMEKTNSWYDSQPWLVGCNYIPANAINQLEMWQAETFDTARINLELGWAESMGMNTLRVFLHDLLWLQDSKGFEGRLNQFLAICDRHHIRPMLVLFDSVWDPHPALGKQREPKPGVHNSGWVQSPGATALQDSGQYPRLESYVKGVIGAFADDPRVLCWDVWNEPDNLNTGNYTEPKSKLKLIEKLLPKAFEWARAAHPSQPLTSGVWKVKYSKGTLTKVEKMQLELSDFVSFHNYGDTTSFRESIAFLSRYGQRLVCTEYMARTQYSSIQSILPIARENNMAMYNWGFVVGKTNTWLPWDSWQEPYINGRTPIVWHHDLLYEDGTPYMAEEVEMIGWLRKNK